MSTAEAVTADRVRDVVGSNTAERVTVWVFRLAILVAILGGWQWYGSQPDVFAIAPVTEVAQSMWAGFADGEFPRALAGTMATMVVGYTIAAVLGVAIGLWIGVSEYARNTIEPLTNAAYATPVALFIPVIAIYTGLEMSGRVVLVVLWCIFEVIVTTSAGVREVPTPLVEVGRSFSLPRRDIYRKVVLPAATPYVLLGLRLAVARAMRGAVTAELLLASANLGLILTQSGARFDSPKLLAAILVTMFMGLILMRLASVIEDRLTAFRRERP
ncbi:ABC transporter permease [Mycobacterium sp. NAZ190054]|uniref:ABC transporter permease n=1 Tax=Mycobacterium sp. NAZ190054 TaxID=1747766 RepID=UPI0007935119|nr:ABC transporter permease [Mycobacterium sp. NAZ190054]KWX67404.1 hypothetical protein ASJ79_21690 [Mycobacterium sp. NAZ190054]